MEKARALVPRLRSSNRPREFQSLVVQFIETVVLYQFPKMSRKEIEKKLQVSDVRETRVFQEGREEGRLETIERMALGMLKLNRPIVEITGRTPAQIRKLKKKQSDGN